MTFTEVLGLLGFTLVMVTNLGTAWGLSKRIDDLGRRIDDTRNDLGRRIDDTRNDLGRRIDETKETLRAEIRATAAKAKLAGKS